MVVIFDRDIDAKLVGPSTSDKQSLRLKISKVTFGEGEKIYEIELYDGSRISFIYRLKLTRAEFERLRRDQGINADFDQVPSLIVDFVEKARNNLDDWIECTLDPNEGCRIELMRRSHFRNNSLLTLNLPNLTHDEHVQHLTATAEAMKTKFCESETLSASLRRDLQNEKSVNADLHDQLKKANSSISMLKEQLNDIKKINDSLNSKIETHKLDYNILVDDIALKDNRIEEYVEQIDDLKEELDGIDNEAEKLSERLKEEIAARNELELTLDSFKTTLREVAEKGKKREHEVVELRREVASLQRENGDLDEKLRNETMRLKDKLLEMDAELDDAEDKLDDEIAAKENALNKVSFMQHDLDKANTQIESLQQQLALKTKLLAETEKHALPMVPARPRQPPPTIQLPARPLKSALAGRR